MADYPVELERTRTLFDGRRVRSGRCAPATPRWNRTSSAICRPTHAIPASVTMNELPAGKLKHLTDVDYEKHLALVATEQTGDGRQHQVGSARYVVDPGGKSCEFAIMVDDDWQSSGLAGMLMFTIMDVAHARGLESMEGLVLASNHKMLKLPANWAFRSSGWRTIRVRCGCSASCEAARPRGTQGRFRAAQRSAAQTSLTRPRSQRCPGRPRIAGAKAVKS